MLKEKTVVFIGHSECFGIDEAALTAALTQLLQEGFRVFLNGGMGEFDWLCARTLHRLRPAFPNIHQELILPYLGFSIREPAYFDEIVFPETLEGIPHKAAIPRRNDYMVNRAAAALCFVEHDWGGAARSLRRAERQRVRILHVGRKP
ncbi:MAG: DUF1273 domain-containing protein [Clostridia bacterium]|nr:DUF1273 domain-containing protein [Clostridia bacterium]